MQDWAEMRLIMISKNLNLIFLPIKLFYESLVTNDGMIYIKLKFNK